MWPRSPALLLLLPWLAGCERAGAPDAGAAPEAGRERARLLQQVRAGLAERDARLRGYTFAGHTREEGEAQLSFDFAYRAPGSMRGSLGPPASRTYAYDGERVYEQRDPERRFTTYALALPGEARAALLTELFSPFLPEGFRAPLLPREGVQAEATAHRLAAQAVRLTVSLPEGQGEVQYLLRWPSLDFLGKRTRTGAPGSGAELRVEQERCEPALRLCVPLRLTRWVEGRQVGETQLTQVTLNPALPADSFRLAAPAGYEAHTQRLVPQGAAAPTR